jgi:hypothetical protein
MVGKLPTKQVLRGTQVQDMIVKYRGSIGEARGELYRITKFVVTPTGTKFNLASLAFNPLHPQLENLCGVRLESVIGQSNDAADMLKKLRYRDYKLEKAIARLAAEHDESAHEEEV